MDGDSIRCGKPDVCAGEGFHGIGIVGRTANGLQIYLSVIGSISNNTILSKERTK